MTSAKVLDFYPLSLSHSCKLMLCYCLLLGQPPSPQCRRHAWMAPQKEVPALCILMSGSRIVHHPLLLIATGNIMPTSNVRFPCHSEKICIMFRARLRYFRAQEIQRFEIQMRFSTESETQPKDATNRAHAQQFLKCLKKQTFFLVHFRRSDYDSRCFRRRRRKDGTQNNITSPSFAPASYKPFQTYSYFLAARKVVFPKAERALSTNSSSLLVNIATLFLLARRLHDVTSCWLGTDGYRMLFDG